MLSDEEKKALKDCDIIFINLEDMMSEEGANDYRKSYKILRNLIEKQTKEIEELKDSNNKLYNILQDNKQQTKYSLENNDKKWEDKIKAKIEELKIKRDENADEIKRNLRFYSIYESFNLEIQVLQSLLEKE